MFSSWVKRSTKAACRRSSGSRSLLRGARFRPNLEKLETRTTPAFVSGTPLTVGTNQIGGALSIAAGDFDKDGKLDIVASRMDHEFQLYEGNGNGTFKTPIDVAYADGGQHAYYIAAADLNGDGNLDVVTSDQERGNVYISLGNGDGTFKDVVSYSANHAVRQILITDVDGNGTPDLLISGMLVLLNRGDGTFFPAPTMPTPSTGSYITLGHFFGIPNRLDVAAFGGLNQILLYRSNGDGTFQAGQVIASDAYFDGGMTTADVNKDGKDDLLAAYKGTVQVFLGNGDGTFQAPASFPAHGPSFFGGGQLITADLRHDGRVDLIVANEDEQDISVLLGNNDGTFQPATNYVFNYYVDTVVSADFDGDGNLDVIAGDYTFRYTEFIKGNGNGTFQSSIDYQAPGTKGIASIANGDVNHDGVVDLVATTFPGPGVNVWIGNGDGTYQPPISYTVGIGPEGLCLADLNNDGNLDIVAADLGDPDPSQTLSILFGNCDGTFKPVQYLAGLPQMRDVAAVDLNGDGNLDLAAVAPNSNTLSIYYGKGDGTFQSPVNYSTDVNPIHIVVADFNGDNKPDLLVTTRGNPDGYFDVELNRGDGSLLIPPSAQLAGYQLSDAFVYDLRDNGINDILYAGGNGGFGLFLGNGDGTFQAGQTTGGFDGDNSLVVGDFDGDGVADVALSGYLSGEVMVLKGNGAGVFTQESDSRNAGPRPNAMVAADLNNDGMADLAVADLGQNYITVFRNQSQTSVYFLVTAQSTPGNGVPTQFVITAVNAAGQTLTNYSGTVHFTSNDSNAQLPDDLTLTNGVGVVTATFSTDGNEYLRATDTTNPKFTGTSVDFFIGQPEVLADHFGFTGAPGAVQAGYSFDVTVTAYDSFNRVIAGYTGTVHFSSTDPHVFLPSDYTFSAGNEGVYTFNFAFSTVGIQAITVALVGDAAVSASQSGIIVRSGPAHSVTLSSSSASVQAGSPFLVTLTATDSEGNVATGYRGTVQFSSSDSQAVLPAAYTFTASDGGTHSFLITLKTLGSQNVVATDLGLSSFGSAVVETVTPGPAALQMTTIPDSVAGAAQSFTITAVDADGNKVTNYAGTVAFSSSDVQAGLPADYTFVAADGGVHTFIATLKTAGSQSLTVQDATNHLTISQSGISISAAAANSLVLSGLAGSGLTGVTTQFTIAAIDAFGNPVPTFVDKVHFSSSDLQATLPADYTFVAADHGTHQFSMTPATVGTQTLSVTDMSVGSVTAAQASIVVSANPASKFGLTMPTGMAAGAAVSLVVKVYDAEGNAVTNYTGTIHITSTDPKANLPSDYTFVASDHGSKTFGFVSFETAGSWSLTVTDVANASLIATQNSIAVAPGAATHLKVSNYQTQTTAGMASNITVTALDKYENIATGFVGAVHFSSTDGQAGLPGNYTFVAADQGVKTVSTTLKTAGSQTITTATLAAPVLSVTTDPVSVSAGALAKLAFLQQPTTGASGVAFKPAVTVQLLDAFGNVATASTSQVSFTLGASGNGQSLGGSTSAVPVNGLATFSNLVVSGSGIGLTLQASATGVTNISSAKFNRVILSNILPVVAASPIYGPGPNASVQEAFVKGIYSTLLGRVADASGLVYWVGILKGGAARSSIVTAFWNSSENRGREVDAYYRVYLGRNADQQGHGYWVSQLQAGADETAIVLSFLLSAEELKAPNDVFVQRLYQGALGRGASAADVSYWVGQLAQGTTRQQVANSFVFSGEAAGVAVDSFYEAYFQRTSDAGGRAYWIGQISNRQASYANLAITLLESDEFFKNAAANVP